MRFINIIVYISIMLQYDAFADDDTAYTESNYANITSATSHETWYGLNLDDLIDVYVAGIEFNVEAGFLNPWPTNVDLNNHFERYKHLEIFRFSFCLNSFKYPIDNRLNDTNYDSCESTNIGDFGDASLKDFVVEANIEVVFNETPENYIYPEARAKNTRENTYSYQIIDIFEEYNLDRIRYKCDNCEKSIYMSKADSDIDVFLECLNNYNIYSNNLCYGDIFLQEYGIGMYVRFPSDKINSWLDIANSVLFYYQTGERKFYRNTNGHSLMPPWSEPLIEGVQSSPKAGSVNGRHLARPTARQDGCTPMPPPCRPLAIDKDQPRPWQRRSRSDGSLSWITFQTMSQLIPK